MVHVMQSFLIKLGMLALTMGVVFWIGWQVPQASVKGTLPGAGVETIPQPPADLKAAADNRGVNSALPEALKNSAGANEIRVAAPRPGLIDLNRAAAEDLESLPGIGAVLAQRVIAYRNSIGQFQRVEELRRVKGIGAKKFNQIKTLVTVAELHSKDRTGKPRT